MREALYKVFTIDYILCEDSTELLKLSLLPSADNVGILGFHIDFRKWPF